jgi:hypothetical protein
MSGPWKGHYGSKGWQNDVLDIYAVKHAESPFSSARMTYNVTKSFIRFSVVIQIHGK